MGCGFFLMTAVQNPDASLSRSFPCFRKFPGAEMQRRSFLKNVAGAGVLVGAGALGAPSLVRAASPKVLRFVPQADLANFDPIWGTQLVVRNASAMVWDTLYGFDSEFRIRPQMLESDEVSADGLVWTFKLRPGLRFHDGEPVLAKDVVASLDRWSQRDNMGVMVRKQQKELVALDDRTFRWTLGKPFPKLRFVLGKMNTPVAFIMPERIAKTDPFKKISEYVGSGPFRFVANEWVPGSMAVFERFDGYLPREEPASWMAGGKRALLDRVEWVTMPDPSTAAAALQNGEIDWWENPLPDLVPLFKGASGIVVDIADPMGNVGSFRMNHLQPPFNNVKVRQAVLAAISQKDYMQAVVGDDPKLWKPLPGFFTPGTPWYTEDGGEILKKGGDLALAKKLLAESGYAGEPVVCVIAQNQSIVKAMGDVTIDLLKRLGMNVEFVATDWATVGTRRTSKAPPSEGGWSVFHSWHMGADCIGPYTGARASGENAWFGWPTDANVEKAFDDWFAATDLAGEQEALRRVNRFGLESVVYAPTGFFLTYSAWRSNVKGIAKGPLPFFWGVSKA